MPDAMSAIRVSGLSKRYGEVAAVRSVTFEVEYGEIFGLLGPNGAGKTTTLECLLGLRTPDAGAIMVGEVDALRHPPAARALIGAVLQATALQDRVTPREALRLFAALRRQPAARAEALLAEFGLGDKRNEAFETLSGGQRQRLALALSFVHNPRILVLDEPTAGLDPGSRRDLHDRLAGARSRGCAVLLSTHDMAEAERLCTRVAIMHAGRIASIGSPESLIAQAGATARIRLRTAPPLAPRRLARLPQIASCEPAGDDLVIRTPDTTAALQSIAREVAEQSCTITDLRVLAPSLEDAFLHLTRASQPHEAAQP